ncbi:MAG: DUF1579 family protein [Planctomycetota bacterium]
MALRVVYVGRDVGQERHQTGSRNAEPWGWRTVYRLLDDDHLAIRAYNVTPAGEETLAVEMRYERVG